MTSIIIPAYNEGQVIGRLLRRLVPADHATGLDIIVVANGCTDNTVEIARSFEPPVRVIDLPGASKYNALAAGDQAARDFPRIYADADIELGLADVRALEHELRKPGILAAAPVRVLAIDECPRLVRWYYEVWERLPPVRDGLFARGAIAVSRTGHLRLAALPPLMADDLAISLSFRPGERGIAAGALAIAHPPRKLADLVRRRIRAATGVMQVERTRGAPPSTQRTSPGDLLAVLRDRPGLAPGLCCFLAVTVLARASAWLAAARGDYTTWRRDESSRKAAAQVLTAPPGRRP